VEPLSREAIHALVEDFTLSLFVLVFGYLWHRPEIMNGRSFSSSEKLLFYKAGFRVGTKHAKRALACEQRFQHPGTKLPSRKGRQGSRNGSMQFKAHGSRRRVLFSQPIDSAAACWMALDSAGMDR
jgi:hypothetical protein